MAKIKDILEIESQRASLEQCRFVNLFQEGTFYRAYEWSAWLCVRYIQQFKTTKRLFKNEDTSLVFVGFPITSLQKFIPEGAETSYGEDKSARIMLPEGVFQGEELEKLHEDYDNWKQSVPFTETSKKEIDAENGQNRAMKPARLTDILHEVLAYPIEQKSPLECMVFLAEIKKEIAEII